MTRKLNKRGRFWGILPVAAAAFLLITHPALVRADTTYWRVTIDRVTVVSDANAQRCTRLATQFLAFESILRHLVDWSSDYALPPVAVYSLSRSDAQRVLLSDSERQRERANGYMIFSKYLPGRDFNIAAIVDEGGSDDALQSVLLLYAEGLLVTGPTQRHPPWFQLGVANLLNGLLIRPDGSVLLNRTQQFEPMAEHGGQSQVHFDLQRLLDTKSRDLREGDYKEFIARARSWALFGLLTTDERRSHYRELATLIRQGEPAVEAVKDSFGVPFEQVDAEFENGRWRNDVQYRLSAPGPAIAIPAPQKIDAKEVDALLQVVAQRATHERPQTM